MMTGAYGDSMNTEMLKLASQWLLLCFLIISIILAIVIIIFTISK